MNFVGLNAGLEASHYEDEGGWDENTGHWPTKLDNRGCVNELHGL